MSELNIPTDQYSLFKFFIELPKELKQQIIEQIKLAPLGLTPPTLADFVSEGVKKISKERLEQILNMVLSLSIAKDSASLNISDFLEKLSKALTRTKVKELRPTKDVMFDFEQLLMNSATIFLTGKIIDRMLQNTKTFLDALFIQDIRPVFDDEDNLIGSVTINNLKLVFKEDGKVKETYFALDDTDLDKFSIALKKAQEKLRLIKTFFPNAKMIDIK